MKPVAAVVLLIVGGIVGCGSRGACSLVGTASFAGEPIRQGSIRLDPIEVPGAKRAAARIVEGKFDISIDQGLLAGVYRVSIYGTRSTGRQIRPRENLHGGIQKSIPESEQFIPDKYNNRTELTVDLAPGLNTKGFNID
jgi:hypothetical protein